MTTLNNGKKQKPQQKNAIYEMRTHNVDHATGEIIESRVETKFKVDREPDFVKLYLADIIRIKDVPAGMSNILMRFLGCMGYQNTVLAYMPVKKMIAHDLNISVSYVNKAIGEFVKAGLFMKIDRGMYLVDPELFGRGKWEDINNLRLNIEYDRATGKKTLSSNISSQLKLELKD